MPSQKTSQKTYHTRSTTHKTAAGRKLLQIMSEKRTNLCLSIDLTNPSEIIPLVTLLGPKICLLKTHIDIISFPPSEPNPIGTFTAKLQELARQHNFMIFEDRKFADIGNTVQEQYRGGVYKIASWAHITNAHAVPGPGIIRGLQAVAERVVGEPRGLLLLAEMSSKGNLGGGEYLKQTLAMAREEGVEGFVVGFIAMSEVGGEVEGEDFIVMTPGVGLEVGGDGLGQQYRTPEEVVGRDGCDVVIVGRGIVKDEDPLAVAEVYRERAWRAYEGRVGKE
ncbi:orotidine 5'-phosphate decarboxylase [Choiromyces venosus 120613-1]|uniref:Orotidine 5'-phosphate decarboxylase n=1 Tax=Choiromyces venosus 120613-1 TaxID=1336337 RepID=A0A3N4K7W6_9PEZI|nr:orotidine 5'-phosphate decarboxylase [Choiromyces venosus 120613-1]